MGKAGSGYKKPANKKSYTKKDIIQVSLIIAAIVALVAVFAIVVSNDDFIRTKNGRLQMEDNWLVAQFARKNGTVWYQVGEVGDIEGYTLGTESIGNSVKYIYPEDPANNVVVVYVGAAVSDYEEMNASLTSGTMFNYAITEAPASIELNIAGKDAVMTNCVIPAVTDVAADETADTETADAETADEEPAQTEETENADEAADNENVEDAVDVNAEPGSIIYACIDYDDERCIFIQVNTYEAVTDEEAAEIIETVGSAITLIER